MGSSSVRTLCESGFWKEHCNCCQVFHEQVLLLRSCTSLTQRSARVHPLIWSDRGVDRLRRCEDMMGRSKCQARTQCSRAIKSHEVCDCRSGWQFLWRSSGPAIAWPWNSNMQQITRSSVLLLKKTVLFESVILFALISSALYLQEKSTRNFVCFKINKELTRKLTRNFVCTLLAWNEHCQCSDNFFEFSTAIWGSSDCRVAAEDEQGRYQRSTPTPCPCQNSPI